MQTVLRQRCSFSAQHHVAVNRAIERMRVSLGDTQPLVDLARTAPFSPFHFHRMFREATGATPGRFLAALRMSEARRLLLRSRATIAAISGAVGYISVSTFTTQFSRLVGVSPGRFRRVARGLPDRPVDLARLHPADRPGDVDSVPVRPAGAPADSLVIAEVRPPGSVVAPVFWDLRLGGAEIPLPVLAGREWEIRVVAVPPGSPLARALVDHTDGHRLVGVARLAPDRAGPGYDAIDVPVRRPLPTDPHLLSAAPLRWLADRTAEQRHCRPLASAV